MSPTQRWGYGIALRAILVGFMLAVVLAMLGVPLNQFPWLP